MKTLQFLIFFLAACAPPDTPNAFLKEGVTEYYKVSRYTGILDDRVEIEIRFVDKDDPKKSIILTVKSPLEMKDRMMSIERAVVTKGVSGITTVVYFDENNVAVDVSKYSTT